ncbi:MAG: transglutaminase-like cysteine peptidase [Alphaproteobacteria bacterium]|nr:transglutaminase-like cysteine peptidase [Alphaproteobacteria bacterium]MCL2505081.1 transglutaminase-like cysteine peptidase [Alphaproteobacteria bacterium]
MKAPALLLSLFLLFFTSESRSEVSHTEIVEPKPPVIRLKNVSAGTEDIRDLGLFPKWLDMLNRFKLQSSQFDSKCGKELYTACKFREWKSVLEEMKEESLFDKLISVNRFINGYPYIDDVSNWGQDNYWATPYEFQERGGNCKDYATAKYMALRVLGVPADDMSITVLKDLNANGTIHAVLVADVDGVPYILDNQIKQVLPTYEVPHYVPVYSINEDRWKKY